MGRERNRAWTWLRNKLLSKSISWLLFYSGSLQLTGLKSRRNIRWTKYVLIIIERQKRTRAREEIRIVEGLFCSVRVFYKHNFSSYSPLPSLELLFVNSQQRVRWISISFVVRKLIDFLHYTKLAHRQRIKERKVTNTTYITRIAVILKTDSSEFNQW